VIVRDKFQVEREKLFFATKQHFEFKWILKKEIVWKK